MRTDTEYTVYTIHCVCDVCPQAQHCIIECPAYLRYVNTKSHIARKELLNNFIKESPYAIQT